MKPLRKFPNLWYILTMYLLYIEEEEEEEEEMVTPPSRKVTNGSAPSKAAKPSPHVRV